MIPLEQRSYVSVFFQINAFILAFHSFVYYSSSLSSSLPASESFIFSDLSSILPLIVGFIFHYVRFRFFLLPTSLPSFPLPLPACCSCFIISLHLMGFPLPLTLSLSFLIYSFLHIRVFFLPFLRTPILIPSYSLLLHSFLLQPPLSFPFLFISYTSLLWFLQSILPSYSFLFHLFLPQPPLSLPLIFISSTFLLWFLLISSTSLLWFLRSRFQSPLLPGSLNEDGSHRSEVSMEWGWRGSGRVLQRGEKYFPSVLGFHYHCRPLPLPPAPPCHETRMGGALHRRLCSYCSRCDECRQQLLKDAVQHAGVFRNWLA